MPSATPSNIRVIVRLPYNRPDNPQSDPPRVEWNSEKEKILWEVIARSRATDNGGTDWKGLAAHLEVPLPYLLYRAQTRYEEDLRGLQDIKGTLSPIITDVVPEYITSRVTPIRRLSAQGLGAIGRTNSSMRMNTPLGIRARLNSLGPNSPAPRPTKAVSSSVITLKRPLQAPSRSSSDESSDSEDIDKSEDADRQLEEQQTLDRKLKDLERMMTGERLGLVRNTRAKDKNTDRGRTGGRSDTQSQYRSLDSSIRSESVSSAGSPPGSIPSIPSPPPEPQTQSPMRKHMGPGKSSSPPALSSRSALSHSHIRYGGLVGMAAGQGSDSASNHGSSASSFSDLSDASLSASALESALMSNRQSRLSVFTRGSRGLR